MAAEFKSTVASAPAQKGRIAPSDGEMRADASAPSRARSRLLEWIGPGVITGASDDDPSGIGTYSQAGAQFGLSMLWVMLFTFPLMAGVQIICARIGRVTGRGLASNLARITPRWLLILLMVLLVTTNVINIGADLAAMGAATALLAPVSPVYFAVGFGVISMLLQVFVPYSRYVRLLQWLTFSLLAYVGTAFTVEIPWRDVALHTFVPHLQWKTEYGQMLIAVLGTTISPYLFFWQAAQEVEEQRAQPDERPVRSAPEQAGPQLRKVQAQTLAGMLVSNGIGFFIMLTAAVTLYAHGAHDVDSAAQAAEALRPIAGNAAFAMFALGILGTGLLAIPVLAGSAGYALAECFAWRRGLEQKPQDAKRFYAVIALATLAGCAMTLMHVNPMRALVWAAVLNGVMSVPILVATILVARNRALMDDFVIGPALTGWAWITVALMAASAVVSLL